MTQQEIKAALDEVQAKLAEARAEVATDRAIAAARARLGPEEPPTPVREPDEPGVKRCTCGHRDDEHARGFGVCHASHEKTITRSRTVYDIVCKERHVHEHHEFGVPYGKRECYAESREEYTETESESCECRRFNTREQLAAEVERRADACASCGHPRADHPLSVDAYCRCSLFVGDPASPGKCMCAHPRDDHKDGKCSFTARDAHRGVCKHRMDLDPPAPGNIVGTGHYPYNWTCHECSGYRSNRELDSWSTYEIARMQTRVGQQ